MGYNKMLKNGKVRILGHNYSLSEKDNLGRDINAIGQSCANSQTIKIDSSLPLENKQTTLLHEIIEQLVYMLELDLEHNKIQSLEDGLFNVIQDNKGIFNFEEDYKKGDKE
jgi:hypothetical protein